MLHDGRASGLCDLMFKFAETEFNSKHLFSMLTALAFLEEEDDGSE